MQMTKISSILCRALINGYTEAKFILQNSTDCELITNNFIYLFLDLCFLPKAI